MLKTAIFPGTFDPFTLGHFDIAKRAANLCDHLIIAIGSASHKSTLLSLKDRLNLTQKALAQLPNISVLPLNGLLVDFAKQHQAQGIIRGIRNTTDFAYENQLQQMNRQLTPEIETIFLTPKAELAFISSTLVRDVVKAHADYHQFLPPIIAEYFDRNN